jgi:mannose-1-phosphate guanylyltransferase
MVVMPADHVIGPDDVFQQAVRQAAALVEDDESLIVTFGIRPTYPAESFGYIERGERIATSPPTSVFQVKRFREKPNAELARQFVESGEFYWNSGIFVWKCRTILDALERYEPEMHRRIAAISETIGTEDFSKTFKTEFEAIQGKSIDFAVMEHYGHVAVIEAPFEWDDLGSWRALTRLHGADENGNTLVGRNLIVRATNSMIRSSDNHLVAAIGVDHLIVVHTPDATLVVQAEDEEAVREIVNLIREKGWDEYL